MGLLAQVVGVEISFREINCADPVPSGASLPTLPTLLSWQVKFP